ncbi:FeoA family protein [Comamonas aquatica]|uniref:FeoA family protein n=1 Tax=Comamonas aquatica TaxID=225991 RepID=UPI0022DDA93A|nr:FeoA family protein [Comamonas aquatica]MDH1900925.1 ferrous iron transport protein A [Comamonas aquatica]WBM41169.1 ferrous iron transport protein A [Comamonas aquatica]
MHISSSAAPAPVAASARPGGSAALVSLDSLALRVPARVMDWAPATTEHEQGLLLRLMEIGFLPGELVRVVSAGFPGADPLAVRIGQATFALRRHEASMVLVQPEANA